MLLGLVISGDSYGAGMYVNGVSSLSLSDCRFENNDGSIGGGLLTFSPATVSVTDCQFLSKKTIGGELIRDMHRLRS